MVGGRSPAYTGSSPVLSNSSGGWIGSGTPAVIVLPSARVPPTTGWSPIRPSIRGPWSGEVDDHGRVAA